MVRGVAGASTSGIIPVPRRAETDTCQRIHGMRLRAWIPRGSYSCGRTEEYDCRLQTTEGNVLAMVYSLLVQYEWQRNSAQQRPVASRRLQRLSPSAYPSVLEHSWSSLSPSSGHTIRTSPSRRTSLSIHYVGRLLPFLFMKHAGSPAVVARER
eukprot:COSAG03_NODE_1896_length_3379_cov_29.807012_2_plen_154_part_00